MSAIGRLFRRLWAANTIFLFSAPAMRPAEQYLFTMMGEIFDFSLAFFCASCKPRCGSEKGSRILYFVLSKKSRLQKLTFSDRGDTPWRFSQNHQLCVCVSESSTISIFSLTTDALAFGWKFMLPSPQRTFTAMLKMQTERTCQREQLITNQPVPFYIFVRSKLDIQKMSDPILTPINVKTALRLN